MDYEKLFRLVNPYLEKNDFGAAHTRRVLDIAKRNFSISLELQELTFSSIILHDIGGSSVKEQYEEGPRIATSVLKQLGCDESFIQAVCEIIRTHHEHPQNPSMPFRVLYDSDKLVMFSLEEFPHYDSRADFDWTKIVDLIYSGSLKSLAREQLRRRRNEKNQVKT